MKAVKPKTRREGGWHAYKQTETKTKDFEKKPTHTQNDTKENGPKTTIGNNNENRNMWGF